MYTIDMCLYGQKGWVALQLVSHRLENLRYAPTHVIRSYPQSQAVPWRVLLHTLQQYLAAKCIYFY